MEKIAVLTDSNSGLTAEEAGRNHIHILPMTFFIEGKEYREGVSLSDTEFFERMKNGENATTTQPSPAELSEHWEKLLETHDKIVYIPMSRGLSGSYSVARMFAREYDGKVQIVDNQRISVSQASSALQARRMADSGVSAEEIKKHLEENAQEASIYVTVDTLEYLKKGGRIRSAEALAGEILNIRPVIQFAGGVLEPYCKVRGRKKAKKAMEEAILKDGQDFMGKYGEEKLEVYIAHADAEKEAEEWAEKINDLFPGKQAQIAKLPLSICCHVGPGALGVGVCVKTY